MASAEFRIVESLSKRRNSGRLVSRFLVTRRNGDGVESVWRLSLPALRALVDAGSDALEMVEERELAESTEAVTVDESAVE